MVEYLETIENICIDAENSDTIKELSPNYKKLRVVHQRLIKRQSKGIWKKLFETFKDNKKFKWLIVDSTYVQDHQHFMYKIINIHAVLAKKIIYIKDESGSIRKLHLIVNEYGMPINFIVMDGSNADCKKAVYLIENINAKLVFADRGYDTNDILFYLNKQDIK